MKVSLRFERILIIREDVDQFRAIATAMNDRCLRKMRRSSAKNEDNNLFPMGLIMG